MTSILVTGGTGSLGQALVCHLLEADGYERVVVFSRDELKQSEMRDQGLTDERLRFFVGDVRDRDRLELAFENVDVVVHAAAMKQVETCERNPLEAVKTNIDGTVNVIRAARDRRVGKVLLVGTDKAVDPVNLYGATKQVAERLMVDANESLSGTRFACTRYGNVLTSRGSVLNRFLSQHDAGLPMSMVDPRMTRFVLTLAQSVEFVTGCLGRMGGGEVFIPRLPAVEVGTIAGAVAWPGEPQWDFIDRRPGEKTHEVLVSRHEASRTELQDDVFVVHPITLGIGSFRTLEYTSEFAPRLDLNGFRGLAGLEAGVAV